MAAQRRRRPPQRVVHTGSKGLMRTRPRATHPDLSLPSVVIDCRLLPLAKRSRGQSLVRLSSEAEGRRLHAAVRRALESRSVAAAMASDGIKGGASLRMALATRD